MDYRPYTSGQTMLCLTCSMIPNVNLARYRISRAKDWVSGDYAIRIIESASVSAKKLLISRLYIGHHTVVWFPLMAPNQRFPQGLHKPLQLLES